MQEYILRYTKGLHRSCTFLPEGVLGFLGVTLPGPPLCMARAAEDVSWHRAILLQEEDFVQQFLKGLGHLWESLHQGQ